MDKELVAYCGLYCPECYKMVVSESAEKLINALKNTHICGSVHEPSEEFKQELNKLADLRCRSFCKQGAGKPDCPIKICCKEKELSGCWECDIFETCPKLTPQFVKNIKTIKQKGIKGFLDEF